MKVKDTYYGAQLGLQVAMHVLGHIDLVVGGCFACAYIGTDFTEKIIAYIFI